MKKTLFVIGLILLFASGQALAQSQTAQSVMISYDPMPNYYMVDQTITYTFDKAAAAAYYSPDSVWNGATPTCTSGGNAATKAINCGVANMPDTPEAPVALTVTPNGTQNHAQDDRCIFWSGGTSHGWSYNQDVTILGINGSGNWTFTFVTTIPDTVVEPKTAWNEDISGSLDFAFSGFIASESYLKQDQTKKGTTKYSFTLLEPNPEVGQPPLSRVQNVFAHLLKWNGTEWIEAAEPINYGTLPITPTLAANDYQYFGNGGVFGNSAVFSQLHAPGGKPETYVSAILLEDNFANNNNDLVNGNVHQAEFSGVFPGITEEGSYKIRLTGAIKGNAGINAFDFAVDTTTIVNGGCK